MNNHDKAIKVSVVMTTYNGEKFACEQVDSILINLDEQDELIIGDDGSTDNSLKILEEYSSKFTNIKIVHNNHLKTTKNLQKLIQMASGDIIFISDQDDVWKENKVKIICQDFERNPNIDLVFHNSVVSGARSDDVLHESLFEYLPVSNKYIENLKYFHFWGCMFAFRKRAVLYILPFRFGFDSWIMFCTTFFKKCYIEQATLMTYRRHGNNLSSFKRNNLAVVLAGHLRRLIVFTVFLPITYIKYRKSRKVI